MPCTAIAAHFVAAPNPTLTAAVAGATGLTGRALVEQLRADAHYAQVFALVRKAGSIAADDKVRECVVDYAHLALPEEAAHIDHAFCCLGTTIKTAGSQMAFRAVDFDAVLAFARAAKARGAQHLSVISALGADVHSRVFYSRVKGEMEQRVGQLGYASVHLLRPSFLLGDRQERRPGERLGIAAAQLLGPALRGPLHKYRPIHVDAVAGAMRRGAQQLQPGLHVSESDEIARMGAGTLAF
jgi:uncharacterized protein YbjT (DUF2867 family)